MLDERSSEEEGVYKTGDACTREIEEGAREERGRKSVPITVKTENVVVSKSTLFQLNVGHKDVNVS